MNLCAYHAWVIRRMAALNHVDDEATGAAAMCIARQCPDCDPTPTQETP